MAGPVWGTAEIRVTADGRILPTQIRRISEKAGDDAGIGFAKSFNKAMEKEGRKSFPNSFKNFFRDLNRELKKNEGHWKDLSHNTRQWTLIIGAVASALPDLAGLVSAAGVGLLTLGGLALEAGIGIGVFISTFSRFVGDIEKVPADVLPARKAFDDLRDSLSELNSKLTSRVFRGTEKAWGNFKKTVEGLEEPLGLVADVIHDLIIDLSEALVPGTEAFNDLVAIIRDSASSFDGIMRAIGTFGGALLTAFSDPVMLSAIDGLVGWLGDLADGFDEFVHSDGYKEWVTNGVSVFEHLGGLITGIGDALSGLFDKQSTDNLNDFIDGLTDFFEGPGKSLIDFLDQLDIPGVVVDTLNNLGRALQPILDFATDFMKANPDLVSKALTALATAFLLFKGGEIILGVASSLGTFFSAVKKGKVSSITKLSGAIGGLALAIQGLSDAQNATTPEGATGSMIESILGGALAGASVGGAPGALVGALVGMISNVIAQAFADSETKTAAQNGWDQLFDPNNYTGAGIGPLKQWFQRELMAPTEGIPESGGGWLDQVVTRWGETLEGFKTEIPKFFEGFGQAFADGWATVVTWYDTNFGQPIQHFWEDTVNFFTVEVPGFFAKVNTWFQEGWANVQRWFDTTFVKPTKTAWNGFINFWTVEVPGWFGRISAQFREGWNRVSTWFDTTFVQPVKRMWEGFVNFWTVEVPGWFNRLVGDFRSGIDRITAPFRGFFDDVTRNWNNFWSGLGSAAQRAWDTVRSTVDRIVSKIREIASNPFGAIGNLFSGQGFASGGVLTGPQRILAGEAGPEAIVPLNRALSQVDPSVRWLSAIAQGKSTAMASGGMVGGRSVSVAPGAIVVNDISGDPRRTANEVLRRLAENVVG